MVRQQSFEVRTPGRGTIDIVPGVARIVAASGIRTAPHVRTVVVTVMGEA